MFESIFISLTYRFSYQALYSYIPQNDDELELRDGDIVDVMEKCDDGWFVGKWHRTFLTSGVLKEELGVMSHEKRTILYTERRAFSVPIPPLGTMSHPVYVCSQGSVDDTNIEPDNQICQHLLHGRAVASFIHWVLFVFLFFLSVPCSLQDLSFLTRDGTQAPAVKALSPNHWTAREFPLYFYCASVCPTFGNFNF